MKHRKRMSHQLAVLKYIFYSPAGSALFDNYILHNWFKIYLKEYFLFHTLHWKLLTPLLHGVYFSSEFLRILNYQMYSFFIRPCAITMIPLIHRMCLESYFFENNIGNGKFMIYFLCAIAVIRDTVSSLGLTLPDI